MRVFDAHCDTISEMYEKGQAFSKNGLHIDFERMKKYDAYTQVFAIFTDPEKRERAKAYEETLIDLFYSEMQKNGVCICKNYIDYETSKTPYRAFLSIEGAEGITKEDDLLRLKEKGVFMIAPVWNFRNKIACGVMENEDTGLSEFGKKIIAKMDTLGIILDVSHMSPKSFYDAARIFKKPICASHSNLKAVENHPRNLTDEQFLIIKNSGGVAGINMYPPFLGESVKAHIDRFLALGGEDNIGLGCDFDGVNELPNGICGIEDIESLIKKLPYSTQIREKLAERNFLRVIKAYNC
ncbi:MAG: membrane dipeptidase [Firmicutes bacterium]|nr:membrane dipeptidase [Bacillota bacterium]